MPREQISFRSIDTTEVDGKQVHTARDTVTTHVGWNRAGWVQVSLALPRKSLTGLIETWADEPEVSLFSEVLTRDEVNKMIRALRKARDQAYGSDA